MIEDKETGIKIAENPIEALWERTRSATAQRIAELENMMIIERAVLEMAEGKLNNPGRNSMIG